MPAMLLTTEVDPWLAVFGRFHIVLLHLPIGLLPGIAMLEFGAAMIRKPNPRGAVLTLTVMAALTAGAALASGLVLGGEKVDSELLGNHKLAGIAMTIVCGILPILAALRKRAPFRIGLMVGIALSVVAGHLGGSLTHKSDFLFKPLERAQRKAEQQKAAGDQNTGGAPNGDDANKPPANIPPANKDSHYLKVIAPIFSRLCTDCHNPDDFDGDLDLTTKDGILGLDREEQDRVIVPGKPDESVLIELCELPEDDEDRMPPYDEDLSKEEQTFKKEELAALRKWILDGCKFE